MSAFEAEKTQTAAVIGAGVVGLCSALEMIRAGYRVTLFDRDQPARQTSFGNAAYLAAEYLDPMASAGHIFEAIARSFSRRSAFKVTRDHWPAFIPWAARFIREASPARVRRNREGIRLLNQQAVAAWQDLLNYAGASQCLHQSGFLELWEKRADLDRARAEYAKAQSEGFEARLLSGDALREQEPALTGRVQHALYYPGSWHLGDTFETCQQLFACFQQQGGRFANQAVDEIRPRELDITLVTHGESHRFDQVVIAAGAWSGVLLKGLGITVPLAAERGYHLTLPKEKAHIRHILASSDRHVVLSPLDCGLRIVGFGEFGNLDSAPLEKRYQQLAHHLGQLIKNVDTDDPNIQTWMGIRPTFPDSLPVIDRHPDHPRIGMAFGHHHLGVTQAAITGKLIAALMSEGIQSETWKPFAGSPAAYSVTRFQS